MNARKGRLRPADSQDFAPSATQQEAQREPVAQPEVEGASFDPPPRKSRRSHVRLRSIDVPAALLVTEVRTVAETVRRGLSQAGWFVLRRSTLRDAAQAIRQHHVALVIALLRGTGVRIRCSTGHVMLVGAGGSSNQSGEGRGGTGSS